MLIYITQNYFFFSGNAQGLHFVKHLVRGKQQIHMMLNSLYNIRALFVLQIDYTQTNILHLHKEIHYFFLLNSPFCNHFGMGFEEEDFVLEVEEDVEEEFVVTELG